MDSRAPYRPWRPQRARPFLGPAGGPYLRALEIFALLHWCYAVYTATILFPAALWDLIMPTLVLAALWSPGPGGLAFLIIACILRGLRALWITWGLRSLLLADREQLRYRALPILCFLAAAVLFYTALFLWRRRHLFLSYPPRALLWRVAVGIVLAVVTMKVAWVGPLLRLAAYGELR